MSAPGSDLMLSTVLAHIHYDHSRQPFGSDGRIRLNYFLDLMSACHDPDTCDHLADNLVSHAGPAIAGDRPDYILMPKRGNILLGRAIGVRLQLPTSAVRDSILFNRWIEGSAGHGCRSVLIDDVASDAELIYESVENAKKAGVYVSRVVTLVDREEGDVARMCEEEGIPYTYCWRLADLDLQRALGARLG